ncbi:MAG: hypothetical protein ACSLE9_08000 [Burkholderiaceae bacterium]
MTNPLLTIDEIVPVERAFVRIYGEDYEMNDLADLSPRETAAFDRAWAIVRAWNVAPVEERTDDRAVEYIKVAAAIPPMLLRDLPEDVAARIRPEHAGAIAVAFLQRIAGPTIEPAEAPTPMNRQTRRAAQRTGAKSSPASAPATAATQDAG